MYTTHTFANLGLNLCKYGCEYNWCFCLRPIVKNFSWKNKLLSKDIVNSLDKINKLWYINVMLISFFRISG